MGFKSWSIRDLALSLNAVPLDAGGYADDEVMSLEWNEDRYTTYRGADGEVTRVEMFNRGAIVTLRYAQTAGANDRLTALHLADLSLPNGAGAGMFVARDLEGRLVVTAERAWIMALPPIKMGKTVQVREWKIELADALGTFVGGR